MKRLLVFLTLLFTVAVAPAFAQGPQLGDPYFAARVLVNSPPAYRALVMPAPPPLPPPPPLIPTAPNLPVCSSGACVTDAQGNHPDSTYPTVIQTISCVGTVAGTCHHSYAGTAAALQTAISEAITNRATWGNTGAIEIKVDPAGTYTSATSYDINSCSGATKELILRTGATTMPAQGTRVSSPYTDMPVIETTGVPTIRVIQIGYPAVNGTVQACNIRLMGLNIQKAAGLAGNFLVRVGDGAGGVATADQATTITCVGTACTTSSAHGRSVNNTAMVPGCGAPTTCAQPTRGIISIDSTTTFTIASAFAVDPTASTWRLQNTPQDTVAEVPYGIWIDRSHIGCPDTQDCQDLFVPEMRDGGAVDSIIRGVTAASGDTNAIQAENTPGNLFFDNNVLQTCGESVLLGGSSNVVSGEQYFISDITFTRNLMGQPTACSTAASKNIFELKNGVRVLVQGNIMQRSRVGGQNGQAISLKSNNSAKSRPWSQTNNVTIRYNVLRDLEGFCMYMESYTAASAISGNPYLFNILFQDNLCDGASNGFTAAAAAGWNFGALCTAPIGCPALAVDRRLRDFRASHNTLIVSARIHASYKPGSWSLDGSVVSPATTCTSRFGVDSNVIPLGKEGTTETDSVLAHCKIDGVRVDVKAWSDSSSDYDPFWSNLLTNATSASITGATQNTRPLATHAVGWSADQCSQFVTCDPANIGSGANNYTLKNTSSGYQAAWDATEASVAAHGGTAGTSRQALGLSQDVGADIAKINTMTGCTLVGNWTACSGQPAPTVSSITPSSGGYLGGTSITNLAGTGFIAGTPSSLATFGGISGVNCVVVSSIKITCETPAHAAGAVNVVVTNPDLQFGTLTNGFTYTGSGGPTISSISASSTGAARGSAFGGYTITIAGTNFAQGATVLLGGNTCGSVVVTGTTSISCITQTKNAPGAVDVLVTNPDTQTVTSVGGFTYTKPVIGRP